MKEINLPADMYNIIAYNLGFNMVNEFTINNVNGSLKFIKGEIKEKKKMTRKEAIHKHADAVHDPQQCCYNEQWITSEFFVKGLEALGLIEFEEEKMLNNTIQLDEKYCYGAGVFELKSVIDILKKQGYTVTKNG